MAVRFLETREVPLADLTRFPGNARRGDVAQIQASIVKTGQFRSIVVRKHGGQLTILAGNHTADALTALAADPPELDELLSKSPEHLRHDDGHRATLLHLVDQLQQGVARCELVECSDDEARRVNVADNRLSDIAVDDPEALMALLNQLDGDFEGTGFTPADLTGLEKLLEPPDLDGLADDLGDPEDGDAWPSIKLRVPHHLVAAWNDHLSAYSDDEAAAFAQLLGLEVHP